MNQRDDNREFSAELIARTERHVDQATVEQLRKQIQLLERRKEWGWMFCQTVYPDSSVRLRIGQIHLVVT